MLKYNFYLHASTHVHIPYVWQIIADQFTILNENQRGHKSADTSLKLFERILDTDNQELKTI